MASAGLSVRSVQGLFPSGDATHVRSRIAIDCRRTAGPAAVQHADDLQRDRALQRPAAAHSASCRTTIRCLLPDLGPIVGYAVTSQTRGSRRTRTSPAPDLLGDYLRYVAASPGPKIAVGQDLDDPPGLGAQFGEVNATIHKKLGCVGHITSGCPRDLDEVRALGFQLFGLNPCVSHAYVRLVDFGKPVKIAGVEIRPGDLIHADKHGVCIIPHRDRHQAGRRLRRGRAAGAAAARDLPLATTSTSKSTSGCGSAMKAKIHE